MADCEYFLEDIVRKVEPTPAQKDGAIRSHNYLRDILVTGQMARVIVESYLSGSYARDTAIAPLDDVDIVFIIQPEHWQNGLQSFLELKPSPQKVLETFARAIRNRYDQSSVHVQRRSVRLQLNHLDIDVVPALSVAGDEQSILVADVNADEWLPSAPKIHEALASKVNKLRNGRFKPLVKLLKHWNSNLPSTANLKSFAIETMAVRIFIRYSFDSLQEGLLKFFDFMCHLGGQSVLFNWDESCGMSFSAFWERTVPDAAGTGSNLLAKVNGARMNRFVDHALRSRDKMNESMKTVHSETSKRRVSEALKF